MSGPVIETTFATYGAPGCGGVFGVVARFADLDFDLPGARFTFCDVFTKREACARAERLVERIRAAGLTRAHVEASTRWRPAVAWSYNACDGGPGAGSDAAPVAVHIHRDSDCDGGRRVSPDVLDAVERRACTACRGRSTRPGQCTACDLRRSERGAR